MSRSGEGAPTSLGAAEALGGRWAFSATQRIINLLPGTALVLVQEAAQPALPLGLVIVSAMLQEAVVALIGLPIAVLATRAGRILPVALTFAVWSLMGVGRGVVGGLLAGSAGISPDFGARILFWLVVGWVFLPMLTYVLAQLDHRRGLLGALAVEEERREEVRKRAARSAEELRARNLEVISGVVLPAVSDIQKSLRGSSGAGMTEIGVRLAELTDEVRSVIDSISAPRVPSADGVRALPAPMSAALNFERSRPLLWAAVSALSVVLVLGSLAARAGRPGALLLEVAVGAAAASMVLALVGRWRPSAGARDLPARVLVWGRYGLAALTGAAIPLIAEWGTADAFVLLVIACLPVVLVYVATLFSFAAGYATANRQLVDALVNVMQERRALEERVADDADAARIQLSTLTHGPILGRLAACAMALNFHAAEGDAVSADRGAFIARSVLEHLDAVSADLIALARQENVPSTP